MFSVSWKGRKEGRGVSWRSAERTNDACGDDDEFINIQAARLPSVRPTDSAFLPSFLLSPARTSSLILTEAAGRPAT